MEGDVDNPLGHLIHTDVDRDGSQSTSELLTVLPHQHHSVQNGVLNLSFSHNLAGPLSISLQVDACPGCGGLAWPAGQILASYLVLKGPEHCREKRILELGSGTGLVGLVVGAFRNATVWITDQAPLLEIMRRNVSLNHLESYMKVVELNWGEPISMDIPRPNIILAADCVYLEPAFPLLVQTLDDLSDPTTEILFCYKKRRKADRRFFGMLKKKFTWKEVTDDPNAHIYNREAITLMRLFKMSTVSTHNISNN